MNKIIEDFKKLATVLKQLQYSPITYEEIHRVKEALYGKSK